MNYTTGKYYKFLTIFLLPFEAVEYSISVLGLSISKQGDALHIALYATVFVSALLGFVFVNRGSRFGLIFVYAMYAARLVMSILGIVSSYSARDLVGTISTAATAVIILAVLIYTIFYFRKDRIFKRDRKQGAARTIAGVALMGFVVLIVEYAIIAANNDLYALLSLIVSFNRKLTAMQTLTIGRILDSVCLFAYVGVGLWLARGINKSGYVSYEALGLSKARRPILSILRGFIYPVAVIILSCIFLKIQGCGFSVNHINSRVALSMICGFFQFIGVGFLEEILNRGIIQSYGKTVSKPVTGVIISIAMFVTIHYLTGAYEGAIIIPFLISCGLCYSLTKTYTDNLWVCIGFHAFYDWLVGFGVEIPVKLGGGDSFISVTKYTTQKNVIALSAAFALMSVGMLILMGIRKRKEVTDAVNITD